MTSKRPGRPRVDTTDLSTKVCISLPSRCYDEVYRRAGASRVSVPELIRQSLYQTLKNPNSPERNPRR